MNIVTTAAILQLSHPSATRADVAGSQSSVADASDSSSDDQNSSTFDQVLSSVISSTSSAETPAEAPSDSASQDVVPSRSGHPKKAKLGANAVNALFGQQPAVPIAPALPPKMGKVGQSQALPANNPPVKPSVGIASPQTAAPSSNLQVKNLIPSKPQETPKLVAADQASAKPAIPAESAAANAVTKPTVPTIAPPSGNAKPQVSDQTTANSSSVAPVSSNSGHVTAQPSNNLFDNPPTEPPSSNTVAATVGSGIQTVPVPVIPDSSQIVKTQDLQQNFPVMPAIDSISHNGADMLNSVGTDGAVTRVGLPSLDLKAGFAAFRQTQQDLVQVATQTSATQQDPGAFAVVSAGLRGDFAGATVGIGQVAVSSPTATEGTSKNSHASVTELLDQSSATSHSSDNSVQTGYLPQPLTSVPVESLASRVSEIVGQHLGKSAPSEPSSVVLRLHPANLGQVNVHVSLTNDVVSIRMVATDEATRQIIERQLNELHQSLANQGISFSGCQVSCNSSGQQSFDRGMPKQTANEFDALPLTGRREAIFPSIGVGRTVSRSQLDYVA